MIDTLVKEDLTYELTPTGGFKIFNKGELWIEQDGYIPPEYIRDTIEESAQAYIHGLIANQSQSQQAITDEDDLKRRVLELENRPHIHEMAHSFDITTNRHVLTGETPDSGIFTIRFKATHRYTWGEMFYIGKEYHPYNMILEEIETDTFVEGSIVEANVDIGSSTITIAGMIPNAGAAEITRLWRDEQTGTAKEEIAKNDAVLLTRWGELAEGKMNPIDPDVESVEVPECCAISDNEEYFALGFHSSIYSNRLIVYRIDKENNRYMKLPNASTMPTNDTFTIRLEFSPDNKYLLVVNGATESYVNENRPAYLYKLNEDTYNLLPNMPTWFSNTLAPLANGGRLMKWGPDNRLYVVCCNSTSTNCTIMYIKAIQINEDGTCSIVNAISKNGSGTYNLIFNMDLSTDCNFALVSIRETSAGCSVCLFDMRSGSGSQATFKYILKPSNGQSNTTGIHPQYTIARFSPDGKHIYIMTNESSSGQANVIKIFQFNKNDLSVTPLPDLLAAQELDASTYMNNFMIHPSGKYIAIDAQNDFLYLYELNVQTLGNRLIKMPHSSYSGSRTRLDTFMFSKGGNFFCTTQIPRLYQLTPENAVRKLGQEGYTLLNNRLNADIGIALQNAQPGEECKVNLFPAINSALKGEA